MPTSKNVSVLVNHFAKLIRADADRIIRVRAQEVAVNPTNKVTITRVNSYCNLHASHALSLAATIQALWEVA